MAVTSVTAVFDSLEGAHNRLWQRVYTRSFRVECDSPTDGPVVVRGAVDPNTGMKVPTIGNSYFVGGAEVDNGSFVESVNFRLESFNGGKLTWLATANYGPYDASTFPDTPTDWPIKFSWAAQKFQIAVTEDVATNDAILNSSKEPFAEAVTIDQSRPILTVVRNEPCAGYDDTLANTYRDRVNSTAWNGYAAYTVKIGEISTSEPQYDSTNKDWYFAVKYVFEFDDNKWKKTLLDQGFNILDASTPAKSIKALDKQGQPYTEPPLLDGSGAVLATNGTPVFLEFDVYPEVDFTPLKINLATALGR